MITKISLIALFVLAMIPLLTDNTDATSEKHQPALHIIDFPNSISVGQTISIPYTFSWYHPNGTAVYTEDYPGQKEGYRNIIMVHISDEFTLLNDDKIHLGGQGDTYGPHFKNLYKLYVNYSKDGTSGSIDLRLEKPLLYDRDIVSFLFDGYDFTDFQTQRTDDGLIFVETESLTDQYDLDQLAFTTWHIQWLYKNEGYANDKNERYDSYYNSDEVHTPQTRLYSQIESNNYILSPYKQYQQGIPIYQIQCNDSKILLESARNTPACVNETSVEKLLDREFSLIISDELNEVSKMEEPKALRRGPAELPILDRIYTQPYDETIQTIEELQTAKQISKQSARQSTDEDFIITDWVPDYIPQDYKLGYSLHDWHNYDDEIIHGLIMQFVPDSFTYTDSTTESNVMNAAGILYSVYLKTDSVSDSFENRKRHLTSQSLGYTDTEISELIMNQTNGYFGIKKPNNEYPGFFIEIPFEDYYVSFRYNGDLAYDEGVKIANSIQGVVIPE